MQPLKKRGRKATISDEIKAAAKIEARKRDLGKNSFTTETFRTWLLDQLKAERIHNGGNSYGVDDINTRTLQRVIKEVLPEKVCARTQNERRFEAIMDALNHINFAAMWQAVVCTDDQSIISPSGMFNLDATSLLLELGMEANAQLRLAEGSKAELKRKGLNPSTTKTRAQTSLKKRGISMIALTCADGTLVSVVVKIKDQTFKKLSMHKV